MKNRERIFLVLVFSFIATFFTSVSAFAHKVNIFAYVEGDEVNTESYFPDGRPVQGGKIEVLDSKGKKLLDGVTSDDGLFSFKIPQKDDLKIVLNATMGHKNTFTLSSSEFTDAKANEAAAYHEPETEEPTVYAEEESDEKHSESQKINLEELRKIIDSSLDKKLAPIKRSMAQAAEKKVSVSDLIGGIGFILGLLGVSMYFKYKQDCK